VSCCALCFSREYSPMFGFFVALIGASVQGFVCESIVTTWKVLLCMWVSAFHSIDGHGGSCLCTCLHAHEHVCAAVVEHDCSLSFSFTHSLTRPFIHSFLRANLRTCNLSTNLVDKSSMLVDKMVNEVTSTMNRLHVLIIGPGLGRCPLVFKGVAKIIQAAQSQNIPLVLDADALFMLTQEPYVRTLLCNDAERSVRDGSISGSSSTSTLLPPCVLTPNVVEYKRLMQCTPLGEERWKDMIICKKGATDTIVHKAKGIEYHCEEQGGWKRSGGIGDVLAGTLGTLVAWNRILTQRAARQGHNGVDDASPTSAPQASSTSTLQMAAAGFATADDLPLACWTACCFAKMATKRAYDEHGRAMTAPDVLAELGPTVDAATRI